MICHIRFYTTLATVLLLYRNIGSIHVAQQLFPNSCTRTVVPEQVFPNRCSQKVVHKQVYLFNSNVVQVRTSCLLSSVARSGHIHFVVQEGVMIEIIDVV